MRKIVLLILSVQGVMLPARLLQSDSLKKAIQSVDFARVRSEVHRYKLRMTDKKKKNYETYSAESHRVLKELEASIALSGKVGDFFLLQNQAKLMDVTSVFAGFALCYYGLIVSYGIAQSYSGTQENHAFVHERQSSWVQLTRSLGKGMVATIFGSHLIQRGWNCTLQKRKLKKAHEIHRFLVDQRPA